MDLSAYLALFAPLNAVNFFIMEIRWEDSIEKKNQ